MMNAQSTYGQCAADWRTHDTPQARAAFADAQARLDDCSFGECYLNEEACSLVEHRYTPEMAVADEKVADRYERLVLQPAHAEFEAQRDEAEFAHRFPEPPGGVRVEFECDGGTYAAYRMDVPERTGGTWWLYGPDGDPRSWRDLVVEFGIDMGDLTVLVPVEADPSPFPLAEGDAVRVEMMPMTVYDLPDPEDGPGEGYYTFAFEVAGERELLSLTPTEVEARVRKCAS